MTLAELKQALRYGAGIVEVNRTKVTLGDEEYATFATNGVAVEYVRLRETLIGLVTQLESAQYTSATVPLILARAGIEVKP